MKKQPSGKKSTLWIVLGLVAVLVIAGVLCYALGVFGGSEKEGKFTSKLYWNLDRAEMLDAATGLSAREAADDGLYYVRCASGGEVVELPVADGILVNKIDFKEVMCLKFDSDGVIIDVVDAEEVYTKIGEKVYAQKADANSILFNSSPALNGVQTNLALNENTGIYNVSEMAEKPGYPGAIEPMDQLVIYGTDELTPTDVFITQRHPYSEVYWRVSDQKFNSTTKTSTRERAEDGYWYMDWTVNGETVTLRTDRFDVINAWDGYGVTGAFCGMVFDENGDVIDCFSAAYAARGVKVADNYDITSLAEDGSSFTATRIKFGTEVGKTYTSKIDENTKIYNVNSAAEVIGEVTELQMDDRIVVLADPMGQAKYIYVVNRMVDSPMYYNVSRNWSSGLQKSQRTPDADGWYHIKLAVQGREVTYRTRDVALVDKIDSYNMSVFGLKLNGDIIVKAYDPVNVTGNWSWCSGNFVDSIDGVLLGTSNTAGTATNGVIADGCEVYDVSGHSSFKGQKTTLREGDRIMAYQNALGEVVYIAILNRHEAGSTLYWNVNRYYSGGQSTRGNQSFEGKPLLDEDGYYNFRVIKVGSTDVTWVKTKDKAIVDRMDSYGTPTAFSLYVNSAGVVTGAYPCNAALGGYQAANYLHIDNLVSQADRQYGIRSYRTGATGTITLAENVKVYDFTADSALKGSDMPEGATIKGSTTSIRLGDKVSCIANREGKIEIVFLIERETSGTQLAVRKSGNANTPDADGYYVFELIINGQVKTLKTKDQATAKKIAGYGYAFAVKYSGEIITGVYTATASTDVYEMASGAYYDVVSISGGKLNLKRNRIAQTDTGKETSVDLAYGYKAYVIDPNSPNFGKQVTLKKGDRIYGYTDYNAQLKYIFVAYECTREGGNMGYCDHCGKIVHWESTAASYSAAAGCIPEVAHFYVPYDATVTSNLKLSDSDQKDKDGNIVVTTEFVVDLNGKTWTRKGTDGYAGSGLLTVDMNNTVIITDYSKAQTGKMVSEKGLEYKNTYTGLLHVQAGSTLIIEKGTFDASNAICTNQVANGGAISVGGTLIVNGGTIKGFKENTNANWGGTAIGSWGNTQITINGGTIIGGTATNMGGTISANGDLTINGGKIYGGTAKTGDNIRMGNGHLVITGGEIDGGIQIVSNTKSVTLSGKPVIKAGTNYGLKLGGIKADVSGLQAGASIYVTASNVFTTELASEAAAQTIVNNGSLKTAEEGMMIKAEGKAIACVSDGTTRTWTDATKLPDMGNWKLGVDVTTTSGVVLAGDLFLDLNGHTVTHNAASIVFETGTNKLTIDDLSGKTGDELGRIVVASAEASFKAGVVYVGGNGEFVLNNGVLDASNVKTTYTGANAGTITIGNGKIGDTPVYGKATINGGKVLGWKSVGNGSTVGMMSKTTLIINGGEIVGNEVSCHESIAGTGNGGTITAAGYLTINGGKIYGGTAEGSGDNIDMSHASATLTITGGEIDGGIASRAHTSITLSGAPVIKEGTNYGLKLGTGKTVDATGLTGGEIYVDASGVFTTDFADEAKATAAAAWLKSGIAGQDISLEGKALKVGAAGLPTKGEYKLTTNMTIAETLVLSGDLIIDLNGYTITSSAAPAIQTGGKNLTIRDTSGKTGDQLGKITTTTISGNKAAAIIYANGSAGTVTIENGIIDGSNVTTTYTSANAGTITVSKNLVVEGGKIIGWKSSGNGAAIGSWGGTQITISGGEIVGNTVTKSINGTGYGGAIAANGGLTINGGKIYGGSAEVGGDNIRINNANSVVIISGGEIDGGVQLDNFSSVTISGAPVIKEGTNYGLKIKSGKTVNMTGLTGGEIYIDATDVFTSDFADATAATAALSFLKSGESGKSLKVDGKAIKMVTDLEVTLSKTELTLTEGADETITATANPAEATITWTSSDDTIATVVNGKITAVAPGTATITVTAEHGGITATKTCTVTVKSASADLTDTAWTEWTDATKLPTAGKYKLMTNVTISATNKMTGELWLDLNGMTVTMTGNTHAIETAGFKLVIDDLSGKTGDELGTIKTTATNINASAAVIYVSAVANGTGGELILNNGIIDGTSATNTKTNVTNGTVVVGNATNAFSTFTMNGGVIKGQKGDPNTSGTGGSCVGLYNSTSFVMNGGKLIARTSTSDTDYVATTGSCISAGGASGSNPASSITINGGELIGSRTRNHGGVIATAGTLTINGGTFYGAKTQNSSVIWSNGSSVVINGGLIYGGTTVANPGNGAIDKQGGTITVGGNAIIGGGINIRGSAKLILTGTPVVNSRLGAEQKFDIRINSGSIYLNDTTGTAIQTTNGYYSLTYGTDGKVNGVKAFAAVTYTESATLPTSGAVKLTGPVTLTEALVTTGNLYIDLNGQTVTMTGGNFAIQAKHNVVITDSSAEKTGKIVNTNTSFTASASVLKVENGKKVVLAGGTLDGSAVNNGFASGYSGAVTVGNDASFIMLGGEVKGQRSASTGSTGKGGGCIGGWGNSNVIIYGGTLTAKNLGTAFPSNAVAAQGSCIATGGNVEIHGGELYGTMATNHGGNIYCTGNLTITGGLISGGYANNSGVIAASGAKCTITGGTIVGGTAHSGSALGGASIDYAKDGGVLTIGGNAKIAGGVSIRTNAKLVLTGKAVIDMNMAGQTQKKFNLQIKNGTCSIYLNEATGTALASASSGKWDVTYNANGQITGITAK